MRKKAVSYTHLDVYKRQVHIVTERDSACEYEVFNISCI